MTRPELFHVVRFVDKHIENLHAKDEDRSAQLHVTDITGRAHCCVFQEKTGRATANRDDRPGQLRRFEIGHVMEAFVSTALFENGWTPLPEHKEQITWDDCGLMGTPDVVALDPNGVPTLIEVKSTHPMALDNMKGKPHAHYVEQVNLYGHRLIEKYPNLCIKLFYMSLDGRTLQFDINYDAQMAEKTLNDARTIALAIKSGMPIKAEDPIVYEDGKYKPNWKIKYSIADGVHQHCMGNVGLTQGSWEYEMKKKCDALNGKK